MATDTNLTQIIFIGTASSLIFVGLVVVLILKQNKKYLLQQKAIQEVENRKQQDILRAIISAQEEERHRLSSNLHDSVSADLSLLKFNLSSYKYLHKNKPFNLDVLDKDMNHLDNTIEN